MEELPFFFQAASTAPQHGSVEKMVNIERLTFDGSTNGWRATLRSKKN